MIFSRSSTLHHRSLVIFHKRHISTYSHLLYLSGTIQLSLSFGAPSKSDCAPCMEWGYQNPHERLVLAHARSVLGVVVVVGEILGPFILFSF